MIRHYSISATLILASFLAGKYLFQVEPETRVVEKIVTVEKIVEKKNVTIRTVETKKPDGTIVIDTTLVDKSTSQSDTYVSQEKAVTTKSGNKLTLGLLAITEMETPGKGVTYGVNVLVPVFGSLKVQALGTTDKKVGLGLALDF